MIQLTFYTTDGCHLCEDAMHLLQQLQSNYPHQYDVGVIDIVTSESLIEQYGIRIPVVLNGEGDLGWPFDYEKLLTFVQTA